MGAFDIARGDVHMKEGITGLRKAVGMADLLGFELEVHGDQPAAARRGEPPRGAVHDRTAAGPRRSTRSTTAASRAAPLDIDAEGYKHLPPGPGLGVELDWDWIDDNTRSTRRTPSHS